MPGPWTQGGRRGPHHLELRLALGMWRQAAVIAVVVVALALVGSLVLACAVGFLLAEPPGPARIAGDAGTGRSAGALPPAPELSQAG